METGQLRCNVLNCRAILSGRAVVTTCTHVFCVDCGTRAFSAALVCPACETSLTQRDDIVVSELSPTEDYKSSALAGLRPELVIEIAGRALSFWTYQAAQEAAYQSVLYKTMEEQYGKLERQLQTMVRDANQEIQALQDRTAALVRDYEMERRRAHEANEQVAEKTRQFQKLQTMYDKLKRKVLIEQHGASAKSTGFGLGNDAAPALSLGTTTSQRVQIPSLLAQNAQNGSLAAAVTSNTGHGAIRSANDIVVGMDAINMQGIAIQRLPSRKTGISTSQHFPLQHPHGQNIQQECSLLGMRLGRVGTPRPLGERPLFSSGMNMMQHSSLSTTTPASALDPNSRAINTTNVFQPSHQTAQVHHPNAGDHAHHHHRHHHRHHRENSHRQVQQHQTGTDGGRLSSSQQGRSRGHHNHHEHRPSIAAAAANTQPGREGRANGHLFAESVDGARSISGSSSPTTLI